MRNHAKVGALTPIAKLALCLLPLAAALLALCMGRMSLSPLEVFRAIGALLGMDVPLAENTAQVLWTIRLPRILLALLVGAGLSVSGCAFQSLFSNPLATPDTLGVASGSSFGAALALLLGWRLMGVQALALVCGLAAVAMTWGAVAGRDRTNVTIILSGIMVSSWFTALVSLVKLAAEGMACLFNTHYPAHALQRASRSLLLGGGTWRFGDTHSVITEENIRLAFGVRAVIGEIETPHRVVRDVVPLEMEWETEETAAPDREERRTIAVVAVIAGDNALAGRINAILHDYGPWIVGRMGLPYPDGGVFIINVTLDAAESTVRELAGRLEVLPGVSVKTTYAQGVKQEGET